MRNLWLWLNGWHRVPEDLYGVPCDEFLTVRTRLDAVYRRAELNTLDGCTWPRWYDRYGDRLINVTHWRHA